MRYVSLFAGIGGFDLALNRLGHECVYANDFDKYAAITYNKNFKHKIDTTSITEVRAEDIPDHELLVGGFPCQSFSIAGKRRGFDDTRGTLFFDIARILRAKSPGYFILENVKGLLSHDAGNTFKTIVSTLDELGYDLQWQVLNSKNFGVPQNRERVFIVGHLRGKPRPEVFPITGEVRQTNQTRDVAGTLQAGYWKRDRTGGYVIEKEQGVRVGTLRTHKDGNGFREIKKGISPTIPARARQDGSGQPVIAIPVLTPDRMEKRQNGRRFKTDGEPTFTLTSQDRHGVSDGMRIRLLTPVECERLQGFPDNYTEGVSDTQRYKQLGNAVTVNVVYAVASSVKDVANDDV